MVSLIVDSGYERLSNTIPVSPAYKSSKIALLCAKNQIENSVFQPSENVYFENMFWAQPLWAL